MNKYLMKLSAAIITAQISCTVYAAADAPLQVETKVDKEFELPLRGMDLSEQEQAAQLELWRFQAEELASLALGDTEVAELKTEHARLANADRLRAARRHTLS